MSGCYIGKAAFQGEDMKIYPFFGPSATYAADTASEGHATDRQTVALPIEERSRCLSPKGHATDRQKVALPFFRRTTGWLSHAETRRTRSLPVPRSPFPIPCSLSPALTRDHEPNLASGETARPTRTSADTTRHVFDARA